MQEILNNRATCSHCGHSWYKRTERPLVCPKCTCRKWDKVKGNAHINKGPELIDKVKMGEDF